MHPILSIERTALDGTTTRQHLHRAGPDRFVTTLISIGAEKIVETKAGSAREAVAGTPVLRRVDGSDATSVQVHDGSAITRDDLLDALRPSLSATDLEYADNDHDFDALESWPHDVAVATRWATWHRVDVDGTAVFGVCLAAGKVVLVDADSPERPFDAWTELLATSWESSDYSAVGMSGFGIEGLFLIRPGLLATVVYDDENLNVRIERVSRRATPAGLVKSRVNRIVYSDRHRAQLALAAHGLDASEMYPGDALLSCLSHSDLHRLLGD